jgi:hypothetical protein
MNVSAMARLVSTLPAALGALLVLREGYCRRFCITELSAFDLWRIGLLALCLPAFLFLRKTRPVPDGSLPPYVADCYKLSAGITTFVYGLAVKEVVCEPDELSWPDLDALMAEVDRMLIGDKEVCPAPPALIREALRAFLSGEVSIRTVRPPLADLICNDDGFYQFASTYIELKACQTLGTAIESVAAHQVRAAIHRTGLGGDDDSMEVSAEAAHERHDLDVLGEALFIIKPDERDYLVRSLSTKTVSYGVRNSTHALRKLERMTTLWGAGVVDDREVEIVRRRWPALTEPLARQIALGLPQISKLEAIALDLVGDLEADL